MNVSTRLRKIEAKLAITIEALRPVVRVHYKTDLGQKLQELQAIHGPDYNPIFSLTFNDCSAEDLTTFILGRVNNKSEYEGRSAEELTAILLGREVT